ncbi:MAG: transcription termination factor Rho [Phycisphaerales bacterium]
MADKADASKTVTKKKVRKTTTKKKAPASILDSVPDSAKSKPRASSKPAAEPTTSKKIASKAESKAEPKPAPRSEPSPAPKPEPAREQPSSRETSSRDQSSKDQSGSQDSQRNAHRQPNDLRGRPNPDGVDQGNRNQQGSHQGGNRPSHSNQGQGQSGQGQSGQGQGYGDQQGQGRSRRKKKKNKGGGGTGLNKPMMRPGMGQSGIPSSVLPSEDDLEREARALEELSRSDAYEEAAENALHVSHLQAMGVEDLHKFAELEGIEEATKLPRADLMMEILRRRAEQDQIMFGEGTLQIAPEGFGFLRSPEDSYMPGPSDIYVSPSQVRRMGLRPGMEIEGVIRPPKEGERYFALVRIDAINGKDPQIARRLPIFEDMIPLHPEERYVLETEPGIIETRVVDLVAPIGRGQRALIVAPPRTGKTVLMQKITKAISTNYPDVKIIVLLIDERPEEVTDFKRNTDKSVEVVASTFDEHSSRHVQVAEMVMEKARRYVEFGEHVVILLDSITRLARAYNAASPNTGKIMSGGIDSGALTRPKKFFGSARAIENGGSLTILGTALVDTGSKADEVIFEEFKGTGNSELHLDRKLVEKRIYPAIDVAASGTRREELLLDPKELELVYRLRKVLSDMNVVEAMELMKNRLSKSKSNAEFLMTMNLG